jgi:hypothetical protein
MRAARTAAMPSISRRLQKIRGAATHKGSPQAMQARPLTSRMIRMKTMNSGVSEAIVTALVLRRLSETLMQATLEQDEPKRIVAAR